MGLSRVRTALSAASSTLWRYFERLFERRLGIETADPVPLRDLGLAGRDRVDYEPSSWLMLRRVLPRREVSEDDVFIDFGCGKGRVLLQAAAYPFGKIIGVELSRELTDIARTNIERARPSLRCNNIELVTQDVLEYSIPDDATVAYFYNPFEGSTFAAVVGKLVASIERRPRTLRIIYYSPREEAVLLAAGAQLVRVARGMRPTRAWSKSNSIRLYALAPRRK